MPPRVEMKVAELLSRVAGLDLDALRCAAGDARIYLVGGAVRDLALDRNDRPDLDVAVEGDVADIAGKLGGEIVQHDRFRTAIVRSGETRVDLASTRAESYSAPGALPDVEPATLVEDLARRDFTVNAMAVPLFGEPKLIDPLGGFADLESSLLRVLHPDSFRDDPTRVLRGARYGARLGLDLDERGQALAGRADLSAVSADRIDAEMTKLAAESEALRGFELLEEWGVLRLPPGTDELIEGVMRLLQGPPWI